MAIAFLPDIPGARLIGSQMGVLASGFRTFRQPLEHAVDNVMTQHIIHQFEVGGEPAWEPLADSTVERRGRQGTLGGYPQDILVETGTLFESVTRRARWTVTGQEAYFSNLPNRAAYGRFHMEGTQNMPERPWIQITSQDIDEVESIFGRWVDGVILGSWVQRIRRGL
jgi:phage gpG-like protein